jgi:glycosyltransferase involved in cell wall biosynthesis
MNAPARPLRALYVFVGKPKDSSWITTNQGLTRPVEWTTLAVSSDGSLARVREAFSGAGDLTRFDLVVTSEYYLSVGINLRLMLTGAQTPHIIWGLNQSRRLLKVPGLNWAIDRLFQRANIVVTHSREEQRLFERIHGIEASRFRFSPWGFDLPTPDPQPFPARQFPYVSLIGRNNRDALTFVRAARKAGIHPVVVTSGLLPTEKAALEADGAEVHENLPFEGCMACIRDSHFNAVLLKDSSRGAGHITLVAAMMLGKAQVVSDASVIQDYVRSPEHALKVAIGNADSCAQAFTQLLENPALVGRMGEAARQHAQISYTNSAILENFKRIVEECVKPEIQ